MVINEDTGDTSDTNIVVINSDTDDENGNTMYSNTGSSNTVCDNTNMDNMRKRNILEASNIVP